MKKRSEKRVSRKGAKHVLSEVEGGAKQNFEIRISKFEFDSLRAWRLGAIKFPGVVLFNTSKVSI